MAFERSGALDFRRSKVVLFDETFKQNGRLNLKYHHSTGRAPFLGYILETSIDNSKS